MNNKIFKIISAVIIFSLFSGFVYADSDNLTSPTVISIDPNSQASITLSKTDINRLYVHGEKITAINFPGNMLSAHNDSSGGIYVNTTSISPFTAFITTNVGLHFSLLIIPKAIPGQTIKFIAPIPKVTVGQNQPSTVVIQHNAEASSFEQSAPYERTVIGLIKEVELQQTPPGYTNISPKAFSQIGIFNVSGSVSNNSGLSQAMEAGFLGGSLAVRVLSVENNTSKTVQLSENEFYAPGVRAIAIQKQELNANEKTNVFEVISNA